jgi:hypothetical protein
LAHNVTNRNSSLQIEQSNDDMCSETIELRGAAGRWGAAAARCAAQGKLAEKARLTGTGKGSVCAFRTLSEPEVDSKFDM